MSDDAKRAVYEALTDGVHARIMKKDAVPPFPAGSVEYNAWLIGYGGQECADQRDEARQQLDEARRERDAANKRLQQVDSYFDLERNFDEVCKVRDHLGTDLDTALTQLQSLRAEVVEECAMIADKYQERAIEIATGSQVEDNAIAKQVAKAWEERSIGAAHVAQDIRALARGSLIERWAALAGRRRGKGR